MLPWSFAAESEAQLKAELDAQAEPEAATETAGVSAKDIKRLGRLLVRALRHPNNGSLAGMFRLRAGWLSRALLVQDVPVEKAKQEEVLDLLLGIMASPAKGENTSAGKARVFVKCVSVDHELALELFERMDQDTKRRPVVLEFKRQAERTGRITLVKACQGHSDSGGKGAIDLCDHHREPVRNHQDLRERVRTLLDQPHKTLRGVAGQVGITQEQLSKWLSEELREREEKEVAHRLKCWFSGRLNLREMGEPCSADIHYAAHATTPKNALAILGEGKLRPMERLAVHGIPYPPTDDDQKKYLRSKHSRCLIIVRLRAPVLEGLVVREVESGCLLMRGPAADGHIPATNFYVVDRRDADEKGTQARPLTVQDIEALIG